MPDSHEDQARTTDPGSITSSPGQPALNPGAEATSSPDSAEAIPGFRDSLQKALKLFVRKHKGVYMLDFDWTLSRLERNIERPATLLDAIAVRMVCDAAYGSHRAWKELLDRLEGTVQQRVEFDIRGRAAEIAAELGVPVEQVLEEARQIARAPN